MKNLYLKNNKNYDKNMRKNKKITENLNILSGSVQSEGCYKCCNCGQKIYLEQSKTLPNCPKCNCKVFEKN